MDDRITISLSEKDPSGISLVRIDGVIDTVTSGELEHVIGSLVGRERFKILIDLAGVEYISSAGWGIFISRIKEIRAGGGDIKLAGMTESVYEIYELLEFENVLKAFPSVDQSRADFGDSAVSGPQKKKSGKPQP